MWLNQILIAIFVMILLEEDTGNTSTLNPDMLDKTLP